MWAQAIAFEHGAAGGAHAAPTWTRRSRSRCRTARCGRGVEAPTWAQAMAFEHGAAGVSNAAATWAQAMAFEHGAAGVSNAAATWGRGGRGQRRARGVIGAFAGVRFFAIIRARASRRAASLPVTRT